MTNFSDERRFLRQQNRKKCFREKWRQIADGGGEN